LDRVLAFGDEWMPNRVGGDPDELIQRIEELRSRASEAGRDIGVTLLGCSRDPALIERFAKAGVHRGLFWLPAAGRADVEAALERIEAAVTAYRGG
jgi:hypothetical protein